MSKSYSTIRCVLLVVAIGLSGLSFAGNGGYKDKRSLNAYSCKDVMRLYGEERLIAFSFLHGYHLGNKDIRTFSLERLANAFEDFSGYCLDQPKSRAINVMSKSVAVSITLPFPDFEDHEVYNDSRNINTYACKDLMRLSGNDHLSALSNLHGYFLGKLDTSTFSLEKLVNAFEGFSEYCLDTPKRKAVDVMAGFSY